MNYLAVPRCAMAAAVTAAADTMGVRFVLLNTNTETGRVNAAKNYLTAK